MSSGGEKIESHQVSETGVVHNEQAEHHRRHRENEVLPIEQEAVQDAVHIDLSWRSWVGDQNPKRCRTAPLSNLVSPR